MRRLTLGKKVWQLYSTKMHLSNLGWNRLSWCQTPSLQLCMDDAFDLRHAFSSTPELVMVKSSIRHVGKTKIILSHHVTSRTWGKAPGFWGSLKAQHAVGGECMLYTRFDTSPSLATLAKFNGLRVSINRSTQINTVQPTPPIPLVFFCNKTLGDQLPRKTVGSGNRSCLPRSTLPAGG